MHCSIDYLWLVMQTSEEAYIFFYIKSDLIHCAFTQESSAASHFL